MNASLPSADSQSIVLLCSRLALPKKASEAVKPLSIVEWSHLAKRIAVSEWKRPGALFGRTASELRKALGLDQRLAERVTTLLDRGGQVAIELERLANRGIWVLTRADDAYPVKLKHRLGVQAPAVLFGAGPVALLSSAGLAVVGSRSVDEAGANFAAEIGKRCAAAALTVFSGAARGVDRLAMMGATECGGTAVGVVADSLERMLRDREFRGHILGERLTLMTPFHPGARFNVGNAMDRNKLIYCLSDYAVVVASSLENGGTRAGALENLHSGWVPLFVRAGSEAPRGNQDLIDRGGIPLAPELLPGEANLLAWLKVAEETARANPPTTQRRCAGEVGRQHELRESAARWGQTCSQGALMSVGHQAEQTALPSRHADPRLAASSCDLFGIVWPHLEGFLSEPRTEKEIASVFCLEASQLKKWLARAVAAGLTEKLKRPVRYRVATRNQTTSMQTTLFSDLACDKGGQ